MDKNKKKKPKWGKPMLTVLVRGRPEEEALAACKMGNWEVGPSQVQKHCNSTTCTNWCSTKGAVS